ncbi:TetR family transcriptional regulator [Parafrankia soli]|uniref:TetR family transcriptional regulator n=2 Tax=Parafrankia soli TaxID=2599596 RepID=A0A1S1R9Z1_9ACTN|nr:TetR/AcrR family transcriptional regulator [Parafrankia soli]OHV42797.1 TetR family transcriptional regulator [Parafrankia soli]
MDASGSARPRLSRGRPTPEETARLDRDVRESALLLFLEQGYEGTSMEAIARAAGTTKATLYVRFPSKELVFRHVFEWAMSQPDWPVAELAPPDPDDLEKALAAIADAALRRTLHPAMQAMQRIAIAQATRFPDLGRRARQVYWPRHEQVAVLLRRHAATGAIVADEPDVLAEHFLAMVAGAPTLFAMYGVSRDPVILEHRQKAAVQLFLRSLRP